MKDKNIMRSFLPGVSLSFTAAINAVFLGAYIMAKRCLKFVLGLYGWVSGNGVAIRVVSVWSCQELPPGPSEPDSCKMDPLPAKAEPIPNGGSVVYLS